MAVYLGYTSALTLYASPRCAGLSEVTPSSVRSVANAETSAPEARRLATDAFCGVARIRTPPNRIDVIAPDKPHRTHVPQLASHVWTSELPPGAFIQVGRDVFVSSPEFCLLQMARNMSLTTLMCLGMAMCGRYWPADVLGHMIKRPAITSVERLEGFLANVPTSTSTSSKARLALRWLRNNAWSPMEASTYLILCLPRTLGGYGLPQPVLNKEYVLSDVASGIVQQQSCFVDLCWPSASFGLEYNGAEFHRDPSRDITRELALGHDGIKLQPVTFKQVKRSNERHELVRMVAKETGKRLRRGSDKMPARRYALLREALPNGRFVAENVYELDLPGYALPAELCS